MTLQEIKDAVENGKTVYWENHRYTVVKDKHGQWLLGFDVGSVRPNYIGLTHADGRTLNGDESEFFVAEFTTERADAAYAAYVASGHGDHDRKPIRTLITTAETVAIKLKWDTMSGQSCWMDAFFTFMTPDKLPPYMRGRL